MVHQGLGRFQAELRLLNFTGHQTLRNAHSNLLEWTPAQWCHHRRIHEIGQACCLDHCFGPPLLTPGTFTHFTTVVEVPAGER